MTTNPLTPGMTCNRGKGKTLWEIIEVNGQQVELSALGKGGYTNKHTTTDELTNIRSQELHTPLHEMLAKQQAAKAAAEALTYRLRYCSNPATIRAVAVTALEASEVFAAVIDGHTAGLAEMRIKES